MTTVKELLGHKDIKMTLRYAHLAPSLKVRAVDSTITITRLLYKNYTIGRFQIEDDL